MENNSRNINMEIDFSYEKAICEFQSSLKPSYNRATVNLVLKRFYNEVLIQGNLINRGTYRINIGEIGLNHVMKFEVIILNQVNQGEISKNYARSILLIIGMFYRFLSDRLNTNINVVLKYKLPSILQTKTIPDKKVETVQLINDFIRYLDKKNHSEINGHLKVLKRFLKFTKYQPEFNYSFFNRDHFINYQAYLTKKKVKEELSPATVYQYLRSIRLFSMFLMESNVKDIIYVIPRHLIQQSTRNNEYVQVKDILAVFNNVSLTSSNPFRDLAIILLIVETGCRPIEVVNIDLNNLTLTERIVTLISKKSHQRTLKISKELADIIKNYLAVRKMQNPKTSSLFLNFNGSPITTSTISGVFWKYNLSTFGINKFSPKSLRHTFITNALNNNNGLEKVAKVVGHKHLTSTLYYFYRDINSIKKQILDKKFTIIEGEKNGNRKNHTSESTKN